MFLCSNYCHVLSPCYRKTHVCNSETTTCMAHVRYQAHAMIPEYVLLLCSNSLIICNVINPAKTHTILIKCACYSAMGACKQQDNLCENQQGSGNGNIGWHPIGRYSYKHAAAFLGRRAAGPLLSLY